MANRNGKWPKEEGPMTGRWMWSCSEGKNIPFEAGKGKRCGMWLKKWMGNRRNSIEEESQKTNKGE